jgi:hypothetical protein
MAGSSPAMTGWGGEYQGIIREFSARQISSQAI